MRRVLRAALILATPLFASRPLSAQPTECAQRVNMKSYSVCLPLTWHYVRDDDLDRVSACNVDVVHCTGNGGGFPLRGAVFVIILPASASQRKQQNPADVVGLKRPSVRSEDVQEIDLGPDKKCLLHRPCQRLTSSTLPR